MLPLSRSRSDAVVWDREGNLTGKSSKYYNRILENIPALTTRWQVPFKRMQRSSRGVRIDTLVMPSSQVSAIFEEALKLKQSKLWEVFLSFKYPFLLCFMSQACQQSSPCHIARGNGWSHQHMCTWCTPTWAQLCAYCPSVLMKHLTAKTNVSNKPAVNITAFAQTDHTAI